MHATLARYRRVAHIAERAGVTDVLPSGLVPATGRSSGAAAIDAVGYIDLHSQSVGVDIACWHTPPDTCVDEAAWRMVFAWITGPERGLQHVSLLNTPILDGGGFVAGYGYETERIPGVGVLRVSALSAGSWQIIDCWGDAGEAERVQQIAGQLAEL